jgi:hypothetical protein
MVFLITLKAPRPVNSLKICETGSHDNIANMFRGATLNLQITGLPALAIGVAGYAAMVHFLGGGIHYGGIDA